MGITYDDQPGKLYFRFYIYRQKEMFTVLPGRWQYFYKNIIIKCWPLTSEYLAFLLPFKITRIVLNQYFLIK